MTSARELSSRLLDLLRHEQSAMADFLVALADFDRKRLWVELGHSSLFYFLHRELGLSSGAAHYRKTAAELIQRFPEVVEPLRDGRLCFTSIIEVARVMTQENRTEVLPRFFHASKQEAKAVVAEIAPREVAPRRAVVTTVAPVVQARQIASAAPASTASSAAPAPVLALGQAFHPDETWRAPIGELAQETPPVSPPSPPRCTAEPLTADLRRLHVTVSKRFLEKLEKARDALSHSHRGADAEAILEAGLDLLIERHAKRKGLVAKPRLREGDDAAAKPGTAQDPRYIPAHVRREVWIRDQGRCQWPLDGGGICGSTHRVQFDHVVPVARGGQATVDGIRLACAFHNDLAARQVFGNDWMDRFTRRDGVTSGLPSAPAPEPNTAS